MKDLINWNDILRVGFSFLISLTMCYYLIPIVNRLARRIGLLNPPGIRTSHRHSTPNVGGISIFLAFFLSFLMFLKGDSLDIVQLKWFSLAVLVIFFVGLKDDISPLLPEQKLIVQLFSSLLLILGGIVIIQLYGFLGIETLKDLTSVLVTIFVVILIINAMNFVDGVDGLASSIGMSVLFVLGLWFFFCDFIDWAIVCFAMQGALFSFFFYNVFGLRNKTFMGDSGSLTLGLIIAVVIIKFNELNVHVEGPLYIESAPAVAIGLLFVPLFDVFRVFILRLVEGKSPFAADKGHAHHRLLDIGFSHFQTGLILTGINLCSIIICILGRNIGILVLLAILFFLGASLSILLEVCHSRWMKKLRD